MVINKEGDQDSLHRQVDLESKICKYIRYTLQLMIGKIVVEFLTINLFSLVKIELESARDRLVNEITDRVELEASSREEIFTRIHTLTKKSVEKFAPDVEKLRSSIISEFRQRFFRIFSRLEKARQRFEEPQIGLDLYFDSKYTKLRFIKSLSDIPARKKQTNQLDQAGRFRFFKNIPFVRYLFPALIYHCDSKPAPKSQSPLKKLIKSSLGVFSALILTFLIHIYFRYQIKADPNRVCITLFTFFLLLLIGLTINGRKFRCIVLLALPYMASSRGRAIVLMNCMSLTTTVVAPSILNNLQQLHHFTICNVDMVDNMIGEWMRLSDMAKWTHENIERIRRISKHAIGKLETGRRVLKESANMIEAAYETIQRVSELTVHKFTGLKNVCDYLINKSIVAEFLNQLGLLKCDAKIRNFNIILFETDLFKPIIDYMKNATSKFSYKLNTRIDEILDPLIDDLTVNVTTISDTHTNVNSSVASYRELLKSLGAVYQERLEFLNTYVFPAINLILPVSFLLVVYSSIRYHNRYVRDDSYHNLIMGVRFHEIDELHRREHPGRSLLPLNRQLKDTYVGLFDIRMTSRERNYTVTSLVRLFCALTPLLFAVWLNEQLAALNTYVTRNTGFDMQLSTGDTKDAIHGRGLVANTLRDMFVSHGSSQSITNSRCLPRVSRLDRHVHRTMGWSVVVLLALTCFQAYIKRARVFVCGCVYPERDHERAVWLYSHLLNLYSTLNLWKPDLTCKKSRFLNCFNFTKTILVVLLFPFTFAASLIESVKTPSRLFSPKRLARESKLKLARILLKLKPAEIELCANCFLCVPIQDNNLKQIESNKHSIILCMKCIREFEQTSNDLENMSDSDDESDFFEFETTRDSNQKLERKHEHTDIDNGCEYFILKRRDSSSSAVAYDRDRIEKYLDESFKLLYSNLEPFLMSPPQNESSVKVLLEKSERIRSVFDDEFVQFDQLVEHVIKNLVENIPIFE